MNETLYQRLAEIARHGGVTRYGEIAPLVGLNMANEEDRREMSKLLGEISRHEHEQGSPLLSAVVIHLEDNMPGNGFFTLATELNLFRDGDRFMYFINELRRVHDHWSCGAE